MPASLPRTAPFFKILLILVTYIMIIPTPVSSFPIMFQDRVSISSYNDDKLVFDVSFTFVLLIALCITWVLIASRMTLDRFNSWLNRVLAASVAQVEEVTNQLFYFSFDTLFTIATSILVDANDTRRDSARPMGVREIPASTITRFVPRRQRPQEWPQSDTV